MHEIAAYIFVRGSIRFSISGLIIIILTTYPVKK